MDSAAEAGPTPKKGTVAAATATALSNRRALLTTSTSYRRGRDAALPRVRFVTVASTPAQRVQ
jgi:hypothetical protein